MKRITVILPDEVYNDVMTLCKSEKRKKSPMAAMLIEDGLKKVVEDKRVKTGGVHVKPLSR